MAQTLNEKKYEEDDSEQVGSLFDGTDDNESLFDELSKNKLRID